MSGSKGPDILKTIKRKTGGYNERIHFRDEKY